MKQHMWVAISYTPIDIEVAPDGTLHTYTNELSDELAREDAKLGCWHCSAALNTETFETECPGSSNIDGNLDALQA